MTQLSQCRIIVVVLVFLLVLNKVSDTEAWWGTEANFQSLEDQLYKNTDSDTTTIETLSCDMDPGCKRLLGIALWTLILPPRGMVVVGEEVDTSSCPYKESLTCTGKPRIAILGAGMAGTAAAMRLHELGHTDMFIIEGSGRVGGRLYGVKFGNFTLEQGALWIHGLGSNPIHLLAKAHKLEATPTDYDDFTIRDENGHDLTPSSKNILIHFKIAIDRAKRLSDKLKRENVQDISWRQGLQMSGWTPKTPVHDAIEYFRRDFEYLFTPEATSLKYGIADTYDIHGDDNDIAVTDSKGYAYIVQAELQKVIEKSKSQLLLNKFVTNINQRNNKVIVSFKYGNALTFDYVILTFGIGVLQGRVVNFDPPLPESKVDRINQVLNGAYYAVFLEFPETFWDETQFILYASKRRGYFTVWQNINKLYPNSNILHVTATESEAKRIDRISDKELKLELMQILRNMYGKSGKRIPDPIKFQTHRWMLDPLFMGSFSINQPGYTAETCHKICEPFRQVYFAGETCSFNFSGFVQGAWYSGKDAAQHLHEDITLNRKHP